MNKGFTLTELIAVIAILAMISTVAGISYTTINNRHKHDSCVNLEKQIENAAIEYVQDNYLLRNPGEAEVSYSKLKEAGYLEDSLENPVSGANVPDTHKVTVTRNDNDNYSSESNLGCGD